MKNYVPVIFKGRLGKLGGDSAVGLVH